MKKTPILSILLIVSIIAKSDNIYAHDYDALRFKDENGNSVNISDGGKNLILFWRNDCAPCLVEMRVITQIMRENQEINIKLIALGKELKPKYPIYNVHYLISDNDPRDVLKRFGNIKSLALPYSVMLDKKGNVCKFHNGIITPIIVKNWVKQC